MFMLGCECREFMSHNADGPRTLRWFFANRIRHLFVPDAKRAGIDVRRRVATINSNDVVFRPLRSFCGDDDPISRYMVETKLRHGAHYTACATRCNVRGLCLKSRQARVLTINSVSDTP